MEHLIPDPTLNREIEILLIEDNPADATLISLALRVFGHPYRLSTIGNGSEALDLLKKLNQYFYAEQPDVILLDWKLPGLSGREILEEIHQDPNLRDTPVVVISGFEADSLMDEPYMNGANIFLHKPVSLENFSPVFKYIEETVINKSPQAQDKE